MKTQGTLARCAFAWLVMALVATTACSSSGGDGTASGTGTAASGGATLSATSAPADAPDTVEPATMSAAAESAGLRAPAVPPPVGKRDLGGGLTVNFRADGVVVVKGKDRWKGKVETTYEAAAFFRDAVPVLARSFEDAQAEALSKLAVELK